MTHLWNTIAAIDQHSDSVITLASAVGRRLAVVLLLFAWVGVLAGAAVPAPPVLVFEPAVVPVKPAMHETTGIYMVTVQNTSAHMQRIVEFKGGCGCITHELKVAELAPGAKAEMVIVFDFRDSVGPQERKLALMTKAPDATEPLRNELVLKGVIPTPLRFSTKALIWMEGEAPVAKQMTVAVDPGMELEQLRVESPESSPLARLEVLPGQDGRGLSITATPVSTDIAVFSPSERMSQHLQYIVSYNLPGGVRRYEKFYILLAKRPGPNP